MTKELDADAADLIESYAAENAQLRTKLAVALEDHMASEAEREQGLEREKALREQLSTVTAERDDPQALWDMYGGADGIQAMAVKAAERDAAVKDIHRCCDTCEWYRPSCGSIGGKRCTRSYEPSVCMECVNWEWRGPQGAGEGGE